MSADPPPPGPVGLRQELLRLGWLLGTSPEEVQPEVRAEQHIPQTGHHYTSQERFHLCSSQPDLSASESLEIVRGKE